MNFKIKYYFPDSLSGVESELSQTTSKWCTGGIITIMEKSWCVLTIHSTNSEIQRECSQIDLLTYSIPIEGAPSIYNRRIRVPIQILTLNYHSSYPSMNFDYLICIFRDQAPHLKWQLQIPMWYYYQATYSFDPLHPVQIQASSQLTNIRTLSYWHTRTYLHTPSKLIRGDNLSSREGNDWTKEIFNYADLYWT